MVDEIGWLEALLNKFLISVSETSIFMEIIRESFINFYFFTQKFLRTSTEHS